MRFRRSRYGGYRGVRFAVVSERLAYAWEKALELNKELPEILNKMEKIEGFLTEWNNRVTPHDKGWFRPHINNLEDARHKVEKFIKDFKLLPRDIGIANTPVKK